MSPAKVHLICDREIAASDSQRAAKVRFMRDYLTDPDFRAAAEAFVASRTEGAIQTIAQQGK